MILFIIFAALALPLHAQNPDSLWMTPYIRNESGQVQALRQTADSGFIIAGTIRGGIDSNVYIVRTDGLGHKLWDRRVGETGSTAGDIKQARDGGFVVAGTLRSFAGKEDRPVLFRMDSTGGVLWSQTYPATGSSGAQAIVECADGGFSYCGWTTGDNGGWDVSLVKTDSQGRLIWSRTFGGLGEDCGSGLKQTGDGGFVVCGWTTSFGQGDFSSYLLRTDSTGKALWWQTYGEDCKFNDVEIVPGGFIIAGETGSEMWSAQQIVLTRVDSTGTLLWNRTCPTRDEELKRMMMQVLEDGFKVAVYHFALDGSSRNMCIVRTDREGEPLWNRMYSNTGVDLTDMRWRYWWRWAADSFARGIKDFFGYGSPPIATMSIKPSAPVPYKNPVRWYQRLWNPHHFSVWTSIYYSLPHASNVSLSVFDSQSREVLPVLKGYCDEGEHSAFVLGTALSSGIYFLRLECDDAVIVKKILILK